MEAINKLINEFYEKYKGLPSNNPIVRMNQKNDAFELVVFDTLYGEEKELDLIENSSKIADELSKYIVAPPDDGVDIVVEHEDIEGNIFDFVQVKNKKLSDLELKQAFLYMEDTAKRCSKNIEQVGTNLKEVLANTGFSRGDARNTHFIVVHTGEKNYFKDQKANWQIITLTELELVRNNKNIALPKVPTEEFNSDSFNNFIMYEEDAGNPAILMNLRAYDLAKMSIKYANSSLGRNVLFGQNLRDSLIKKSATYDGMVDTIINTPEKFWFYNNGITIIAEDFEIKKDSTSNVEKLILKNFSIINGAQTTSAFGRFYKDMDNNRREEDLKKLKNVYVLARVLKINDEEFKSNIAIYNNTQNPITSRDMAANRYEQRTIYNKLLNGTPHIYMEYRRGTTMPSDVRVFKHQKTTNEELAQLIYAGILRDPFTAKDKKSSLFNKLKSDEDIMINKYYDKIFNPNSGELFTRSKEEIDELLFVYYLYKESKKMSIREYKKRINEHIINLENEKNEENKKRINSYIEQFNLLKAINNVCSFYCIDYYYALKEILGINKVLKYKCIEFYTNSDFQKNMIKSFDKMFLRETVKIIKNNATMASLNTWVRDRKSTEIFNNAANSHIADDMIEIKENFEMFINEYIG